MIVAEKRRKANQKTLKLDNEPLIKPINFRGLIRQLADLGINFKFSRVGGALKLVLPLSSEVCHGKAISLLKRLAFIPGLKVLGILPTLIIMFSLMIANRKRKTSLNFRDASLQLFFNKDKMVQRRYLSVKK